jgi:hypothetical protein
LSPQEGYYQQLNVLDTTKSFVLGWTLDDYTVKGTSGLGKTHRAKALRTVVGGTPAFALSPILKPPVCEKDILPNYQGRQKLGVGRKETSQTRFVIEWLETARSSCITVADDVVQ